MRTWQHRHSRRLLATVALLSLPVLAGCVTNRVVRYLTKEESFEGIRGAYLRQDELGIEYATSAPGGHSFHYRIAWFKLSDLPRGCEPLPDGADPGHYTVWSDPESYIVLGPDRVEPLRTRPPGGAKQVPVGRGDPSLPRGARVAVFVPQAEGGRLYGKSGCYIAVVLFAGEDGKLYKRRALLPLPTYQQDEWYPIAFPLAVAIDVASLPIQLIVFALDPRSVWR